MYESDVLKELDYYVWLELEIVQDSTKTISTRSSYQILDYFGDVGAFESTMVLFFYMFGTFFSSNIL